MKRKLGLPLVFTFLILACGVSASSSDVKDRLGRRFKVYSGSSSGFRARSVSNVHTSDEPTSDALSSSIDRLEGSVDNYNEGVILDVRNSQHREQKFTRKDTLSRQEVDRLVNSMDYRKRKRDLPKPDIQSNYISFKEAEEHSADDLDFEGLFDADYGGKVRGVEVHKITPKEQYYARSRSRRCEYAAGATSRDRRYDRTKKGGNNIVLIITPKNFFADKSGKPTFLPSLALKINDGLRLEALIKMINRRVLSAYPGITIERIRHLGTQIILNEAPQTVKISSLKIRSGSEISVTYKQIPKDETSEDDESDSVPDTLAEELPMTPVEPDLAEYGADFAPKTSQNPAEMDLVVSIPEDEDIPDVEDLQRKEFMGSSGSEEMAPAGDYLPSQDKVADAGNELNYEIRGSAASGVDTPEGGLLNGTSLQEGGRLAMSNEGFDFIDQERAVEAEAAAGEDAVTVSSDVEPSKCSYRVHLIRQSAAGATSNSTAEAEPSPPQEVSSVHKISFSELEPCKLETLVSEVNKLLGSAYKGYSLARLEHKPSKRELLGLLSDEGQGHHHLLDLEIINNDELNAILKPSAELEEDSTGRSVKEDGPILVLVGPTEGRLPADQCQVRMTIFVYSTPERQGKDFFPSLAKSRKKHAKPVSVCTHSAVHISKLLEKIKHAMSLDSSSSCIFICGEKIVNSNSTHPVALIESKICVLRCDA